MNGVNSADKSENSVNCQPVDPDGNPIKPHFTEIIKSNVADHVKFSAWVDCIFDSHEKCGEKVGYSRQSICDFCNGNKPIPKALSLIMNLSIQNGDLKQENSRLRRKKIFKPRSRKTDV